MKRLFVAMLMAGVPIAPPIDAGPFTSWNNSAFAQTANVSAKEAFEATKELGTIEAWNAFVTNYPTGFYADLARAYIKKLNDESGRSFAAPTAPAAPASAPIIRIRSPAAGSAADASIENASVSKPSPTRIAWPWPGRVSSDQPTARALVGW